MVTQKKEDKATKLRKTRWGWLDDALSHEKQGFTFPQVVPSLLYHETVSSLDGKVPVISGPHNILKLTTTKIGTERFQVPPDAEFDLSVPNRPPPEYNFLHDPHLNEYLNNPFVRQRLQQKGLVTEDGYVKCTIKEFNDYRQWIRKLKLDAMEQEWHRCYAQNLMSDRDRRNSEAASLLRHRQERAKELYKDKMKKIERDRKRYMKYMEQKDQYIEELKRQTTRKYQDRRQQWNDDRKKIMERNYKRDKKTQQVRFKMLFNSKEGIKRREKRVNQMHQERQKERNEKAEEMWQRKQNYCLEKMEEGISIREEENERRKASILKRDNTYDKERRKSNVYMMQQHQENVENAMRHLEEASEFLERIETKKELEIQRWRNRLKNIDERERVLAFYREKRKYSENAGKYRKRFAENRKSVWDVDQVLVSQIMSLTAAERREFEGIIEGEERFEYDEMKTDSWKAEVVSSMEIELKVDKAIVEEEEEDDEEEENDDDISSENKSEGDEDADGIPFKIKFPKFDHRYQTDINPSTSLVSFSNYEIEEVNPVYHEGKRKSISVSNDNQTEELDIPGFVIQHTASAMQVPACIDAEDEVAIVDVKCTTKDEEDVCTEENKICNEKNEAVPDAISTEEEKETPTSLEVIVDSVDNDIVDKQHSSYEIIVVPSRTTSFDNVNTTGQQNIPTIVHVVDEMPVIPPKAKISSVSVHLKKSDSDKIIHAAHALVQVSLGNAAKALGYSNAEILREIGVEIQSDGTSRTTLSPDRNIQMTPSEEIMQNAKDITELSLVGAALALGFDSKEVATAFDLKSTTTSLKNIASAYDENIKNIIQNAVYEAAISLGYNENEAHVALEKIKSRHASKMDNLIPNNIISQTQALAQQSMDFASKCNSLYPLSSKDFHRDHSVVAYNALCNAALSLGYSEDVVEQIVGSKKITKEEAELQRRALKIAEKQMKKHDSEYLVRRFSSKLPVDTTNVEHGNEKKQTVMCEEAKTLATDAICGAAIDLGYSEEEIKSSLPECNMPVYDDRLESVAKDVVSDIIQKSISIVKKENCVNMQTIHDNTKLREFALRYSMVIIATAAKSLGHHHNTIVQALVKDIGCRVGGSDHFHPNAIVKFNQFSIEKTRRESLPTNHTERERRRSIQTRPLTPKLKLVEGSSDKIKIQIGNTVMSSGSISVQPDIHSLLPEIPSDTSDENTTLLPGNMSHINPMVHRNSQRRPTPYFSPADQKALTEALATCQKHGLSTMEEDEEEEEEEYIDPNVSLSSTLKSSQADIDKTNSNQSNKQQESNPSITSNKSSAIIWNPVPDEDFSTLTEAEMLTKIKEEEEIERLKKTHLSEYPTEYEFLALTRKKEHSAMRIYDKRMSKELQGMLGDEGGRNRSLLDLYANIKEDVFNHLTFTSSLTLGDQNESITGMFSDIPNNNESHEYTLNKDINGNIITAPALPFANSSNIFFAGTTDSLHNMTPRISEMCTNLETVNCPSANPRKLIATPSQISPMTSFPKMPPSNTNLMNNTKSQDDQVAETEHVIRSSSGVRKLSQDEEKRSGKSSSISNTSSTNRRVSKTSSKSLAKIQSLQNRYYNRSSVNLTRSKASRISLTNDVPGYAQPLKRSSIPSDGLPEKNISVMKRSEDGLSVFDRLSSSHSSLARRRSSNIAESSSKKSLPKSRDEYRKHSRMSEDLDGDDRPNKLRSPQRSPIGNAETPLNIEEFRNSPTFSAKSETYVVKNTETLVRAPSMDRIMSKMIGLSDDENSERSLFTPSPPMGRKESNRIKTRSSTLTNQSNKNISKTESVVSAKQQSSPRRKSSVAIISKPSLNIEASKKSNITSTKSIDNKSGSKSNVIDESEKDSRQVVKIPTESDGAEKQPSVAEKLNETQSKVNTFKPIDENNEVEKSLSSNNKNITSNSLTKRSSPRTSKPNIQSSKQNIHKNSSLKQTESRVMTPIKPRASISASKKSLKQTTSVASVDKTNKKRSSLKSVVPSQTMTSKHSKVTKKASKAESKRKKSKTFGSASLHDHMSKKNVPEHPRRLSLPNSSKSKIIGLDKKSLFDVSKHDMMSTTAVNEIEQTDSLSNIDREIENVIAASKTLLAQADSLDIINESSDEENEEEVVEIVNIVAKQESNGNMKIQSGEETTERKQEEENDGNKNEDYPHHERSLKVIAKDDEKGEKVENIQAVDITKKNPEEMKDEQIDDSVVNSNALKKNTSTVTLQFDPKLDKLNTGVSSKISITKSTSVNISKQPTSLPTQKSTAVEKSENDIQRSSPISIVAQKNDLSETAADVHSAPPTSPSSDKNDEPETVGDEQTLPPKQDALPPTQDTPSKIKDLSETKNEIDNEESKMKREDTEKQETKREEEVRKEETKTRSPSPRSSNITFIPSPPPGPRESGLLASQSMKSITSSRAMRAISKSRSSGSAGRITSSDSRHGRYSSSLRDSTQMMPLSEGNYQDFTEMSKRVSSINEAIHNRRASSKAMWKPEDSFTKADENSLSKQTSSALLVQQAPSRQVSNTSFTSGGGHIFVTPVTSRNFSNGPSKTTSNQDVIEKETSKNIISTETSKNVISTESSIKSILSNDPRLPKPNI